MKKKVLRVIAIVLASLAVLAAAGWGAYALWFDPYRGTAQIVEPSLALDAYLTGEQALGDIDYAYRLITERHPAWLDGSDELCEAVRSRYLRARKELGGGATVLELWQACGEMTAALGDGHTYTMHIGSPVRYIDDFSRLYHGTVTAIDGVPTQEIFERFCERYPCERREYALELFSSSVILREDMLALCGVDVSDGVTLSFDDAQEHFSFVPIEEVSGYTPSEVSGNFAWSIDESGEFGIFDLDACVCDDAYLAALEEFFSAVHENECRAVVVDLRSNGGGNSLVANEFLRYIDVDSYMSWESAVRYGNMLVRNERTSIANDKHERVFSGEVYVLTDVLTYSAAMDFAMLIGDNGIGTIVGEASGNLPDSYGDCLTFSLPASGLKLSVSYKKWSRVDPDKAGQPLEPHIVCDAELALEKVRELI